MKQAWIAVGALVMIAVSSVVLVFVGVPAYEQVAQACSSTAAGNSGSPGKGGNGSANLAAAANPSLDSAIITQTKGDNRLAASEWLGSHLESNWKSTSNWILHSHGVFQIQNPIGDPIPHIVHDDITVAEALDPGKATAYMTPSYQAALFTQERENPGLWASNPEQAAERVAYLAERPRVDYYVNQAANIHQAWVDTLDVMTKHGLSTNFGTASVTAPPATILTGYTPATPVSAAASGQNTGTPAGYNCQQSAVPGGPVGQPGTVSGDAVTLAKQVLALPSSKIQFIFGSREDIQATAEGRLVTPGAGGTCASRRPVPVSAALLQVILDITKQYSITIGSTISSHDCDTGRHPMGRAVDINYINGVLITGSQSQFAAAHSALYSQFMDYVESILPRGHWVNGQPVDMGGIGQQECFGTPRPEVAGLNVFPDACTHVHVDVGVAAAALS